VTHTPSYSASGDSRFATTQWQLVRSAGATPSAAARAALSELCERYWYPLYSFVRRRGHEPDEAADLTQAFFVKLLEGDAISQATPERGRFRSFLLASMSHFIANHWRAERAQKRGGGKLVSLEMNFDDGESRYRLEPTHEQTPERIFARRWALTLLQQALEALRTELLAAGKEQQFLVLRGYLDDSTHASYQAAAEQLGISEVAVRVAVHRLREKYRRQLRAQVAQTVETEAEIDQELQDLLAALENG
jgi:RNA polymerase sigma-70 factor (ECF subfamily)